MSGPDTPPPEAPAVLSVEVTSSSASVLPGVPVQFRATVIGTGPVPQGVTWTTGEGGSVSSGGLFVHPENPATAVRVQVVARSVVPPHVSGSAWIDVLHAEVTVEPASTDVVFGEPTRFAATLNGAPDPSIEWSARYGTMDATGAYRAPNSYQGEPMDTVTARSRTTGAIGTATVRLRIPPPSLTGTAGPALLGETIEITGSGFAGQSLGSDIEVLFPDGLGGTTVVATRSAAADQLSVAVPEGAADGPLRVRRLPGPVPPETSNSVPFIRAPLLRVHADRATVASGESTRISVSMLGTSLSWPLELVTDRGTVAGDVYTAPSDVGEPGRANVRACVTGTAYCSGVTLVLVPFRVHPSPAVVRAGETVALSAHRGGTTIPATFSIGSGGGSVSPDGVFTAPTSFADSGTTWLVASDGASTVNVPVGIRNLSPGLIGRFEQDVGDPSDPLRAGVPWGHSIEAVEAAGPRAFVVASRPAPPFVNSPHFVRWIDEYDLTDPLSPVWVGAVESARARLEGGLSPLRFIFPRMHVAQGHLFLPTFSQRGTAGEWAATLDAYDLSASPPVLVALSESIGPPEFVAPPVVDDERVYEFGPVDPLTGDIPLAIRDIASGPLSPPRLVRLPPPPDSTRSTEAILGRAATARDGRAFATYLSPAGWRVAAWDVSGDPVLLGTAPTELYSFRTLIFVEGPYLRAGARCFDRLAPAPVEVGCLAPYLAAEGQRVVWDGPTLFDVSRPESPSVLARVVDGSSGLGGSLEGGLFFGADGGDGIAVYDLSTPGGFLVRPGGLITGNMTELRGAAIRGGYLYAGGAGYSGPGPGILAWWDVSGASPTPAGSAALATPVTDVAVSGDLLLVGTSAELEIWSLADPGAPNRITALPLNVTAIGAGGATVWVGTQEGDLVSVDPSAAGGPAELGRISLGRIVSAVESWGPDLLVVALRDVFGLDGDLVVVDASSPATPRFVAAAGLAAAALDVERDGDVALVLGQATLSDIYPVLEATLVAIDLSTPSTPIPMSRVPFPPSRKLSVMDGIAWVTDSQHEYSNRYSTFYGYDLRNPAWPRRVAVVQPDAYTFNPYSGLVLDGARAFSLREQRQLVEIDLSQPRNVILP